MLHVAYRFQRVGVGHHYQAKNWIGDWLQLSIHLLHFFHTEPRKSMVKKRVSLVLDFWPLFLLMELRFSTSATIYPILICHKINRKKSEMWTHFLLKNNLIFHFYMIFFTLCSMILFHFYNIIKFLFMLYYFFCIFSILHFLLFFNIFYIK